MRTLRKVIKCMWKMCSSTLNLLLQCKHLTKFLAPKSCGDKKKYDFHAFHLYVVETSELFWQLRAASTLRKHEPQQKAMNATIHASTSIHALWRHLLCLEVLGGWQSLFFIIFFILKYIKIIWFFIF
jgi:hypothetical protein